VHAGTFGHKATLGSAKEAAMTSDDGTVGADAPTRSSDLDPLALERQVCFALVVASRSVLSIYRPLLEPLGLTHPQYLVMLALWGEAPLSVREIGALLQLDSPTLSPLLKRLESAGLITRTRSDEDERQVNIGLSARGRVLRDEATKIPAAVVAQLGLSISDLETLHAALTSVIGAARQTGAVPSFD
jgi:MarR family transcriptional regulator, organic hydroperoxide resistance regulator